MILGGNEKQDQTTCYIQEWQHWLFLLLKLSPLLVFEFDFLSLLCNTNTLGNILMMLGTNVEQDQMTSCIQELQLLQDWGRHLLLFFVFFSKKPFLVFSTVGYFHIFCLWKWLPNKCPSVRMFISLWHFGFFQISWNCYNGYSSFCRHWYSITCIQKKK